MTWYDCRSGSVTQGLTYKLMSAKGRWQARRQGEQRAGPRDGLGRAALNSNFSCGRRTPGCTSGVVCELIWLSKSG